MRIDNEKSEDLRVQIPTLSNVFNGRLRVSNMDDDLLSSSMPREEMNNRKMSNTETESLEHIQTILIRHHSE